MQKTNRLILAAAFFALFTPARADPAVHYAPAENPERVDVALIDTARNEIDLAAYVLTDWPVIQAPRAPPTAASRCASISAELSLPSANPRKSLKT
jgi:hypothetical protein